MPLSFRSCLSFFTLFAFANLGGCGAVSSPSPRCLSPSAPSMVRVAGGTFTMGEAPRYREEGPPRTLTVAPFLIDTHEVTNAEFAAFVKATGYVSQAQQKPPILPGAPPEMREPGSAVFAAPSPDNPNWWRWAVGANWLHPDGPDSQIEGQDHAPVVQVSYADAQAYAKWVGKMLPTEAQWEFAARAGGKAVPEPVDAAGKPQANYYQGVFPIKDTGLDRFRSRAPVGCFPANAYGLHDMIGNVWEWTSNDADPRQRIKIIKGGSYLCAANYCARYRAAARQFQELDLGTNHIGFRLVKPVTETRAR